HHLHLEGGPLAQRGDVHGLVEDLHPGGRRDLGRGHLAGALGLDIDRAGLVELRAEHELLEVEDHVGDVFRRLGDRCELVQRPLLGRQPLCGTGVTSWIPRISSPVAASDLMAVSRPEPGPFTNTSTRCRPCSWARRAAASAASWAANGVDLREPLKPTFPALAQDRVLPDRSVIVTLGLLKVDLMWAWPWEPVF